MSRASKVTVIDHGAKRLTDAVHRASADLVVRVGVHGANASASHGAATNGEIAEFHEFGTARVPMRSFVRATVDAKATELKAALRTAAMEVSRGNLTQTQALELIGLKLAGDMRQRIADGISPPLAAATIARKGAGKTTPLINTGQLRSSIDSAVVKRGSR